MSQSTCWPSTYIFQATQISTNYNSFYHYEHSTPLALFIWTSSANSTHVTQPSIAKKTSPSTTENASQSLQNPTIKKNWRKNQWGASTWCLPSQPLLASMRLRTCQQDRSPVLDGHARRHRQLHTSARTSRDFSRTRRETCARAVATLPKSRPN